MELAVLDIKGNDTGRKVALSEGVFGVTPHKHSLYLDVKQYLAHQRQGTHKAKERADITGSTRKIKKQKGTGTARAGSIKSGVFRGGGRIFGPRPRNYGFKLNKNVKRLARKSALSQKVAANNLLLLEDFNFDAPKTKDYLSLLAALNIQDSKTVLVLGEANKNIFLSARNLQHAEVITPSDLSTYKIMKAQKLVLLETALKTIESNLSK